MGVVMATQLMTTFAGPWSDHRSPTSCLFTGNQVCCRVNTVYLAPNMDVFVLGRAIQGLGGGLCVVPLYTLIGKQCAPHTPTCLRGLRRGLGTHLPWSAQQSPGSSCSTPRGASFLVASAIPLAALPLFIRVMGKVPHQVKDSAPRHIKTTIFCSFGAGRPFVALLQVMSGVESADFSAHQFTLSSLAARCSPSCL